jgi:hypothetical protein
MSLQSFKYSVEIRNHSAFAKVRSKKPRNLLPGLEIIKKIRTFANPKRECGNRLGIKTLYKSSWEVSISFRQTLEYKF